jgi:hypothetical protein
MFFAPLAQVVSLLLDVVAMACRSHRDKDLKILLLRSQVALPQRTRPRPARLSRGEKLVLVTLGATLARLYGGAHSGLPTACCCSSQSPCCGGIGRWCGANRPSPTAR